MTDIFGRYQSQQTRQLAQIDSTKYPDTNKDIEANLRRLNAFVDYVAAYLQVMQKGVDQAQLDPIGKIKSFASDLLVLLGGGELLYGIDLGDLQYFLPALGALFGFDSETPFPINLFEAAEHFFLGYVVPLDAFVEGIKDILIGLLTALGLDEETIQQISDLLDAFGSLAVDIQQFLEDILNVIYGIFGVDGDFGPFADLWHAISTLLGGFDLSDLGDLVDPVFHTLAPWIQTLVNFIDWLDQIVKAFSGGFTNLDGILNFASIFNPINFITDFNPLSAVADIIGNVFNPAGAIATFVSGLIPSLDASKIGTGFFGNGFVPGLLGLFNNLVKGFTGGIEPESQATGDDVTDAGIGQSQAIAAISVAVAALEAQLADSDPATILVEEPWEYTGAIDTARWFSYEFDSSSGGPTVDGHQLAWNASGGNTGGFLHLYVGPDAVSTHDDMTVKMILGDYLNPDDGNSVYLIGRSDVGLNDFVLMRMDRKRFYLQNWHWSGSSYSTTTLGGVNLSAIPGTGSILTLDCGTTDGPRYFRVGINGATWTFFDSANVTKLGATWRSRGLGQRAGQHVAFYVTYQQRCASIAHWASQNAA